MSFKLNEQPVAGAKYIRCPQVVIDNRLGQTPSVAFHREEVTTATDGAVRITPMAPLIVPFDPTASVPILDPETGEPTGDSVTDLHIYQIIFSKFAHAETAEPEGEV